MNILHVYNTHRGFGGSDNILQTTIGVLRRAGVNVHEFVRDSRTLPAGFRGRAQAFANGLYARGAVREFDELIRREDFDVVHVHELYPLISPWILPRCTKAGLPVVMTAYDFRLSCPVATHYSHGEACLRCMGGREYWCVLRNCRSNIFESAAYALRNAMAARFRLYTKHVSRFIVLGGYQREFFVQRLGLDPARVRVNECVIPAAQPPVSDPAGGRYVGFAGRFVEEKGIEVMVEACRAAGLPMGFSGSARSHPAVRSSDRAQFVMPRSPAELAEFYRGARVIVMPSLWPETFGMVAAEAMSHGIPVVASRIGALVDTVRDGETGLLFEPGDVRDLTAKLQRLWHDSELTRRLGRGAWRHVAANYSEDAHVERLSAIYREVMAQPAPLAAAN